MGELNNIKVNLRKRIEALKEFEFDKSMFIDVALAEELGYLTARIDREMCVYISRSGEIVYSDVGEEDRASLADMTLRRSAARLSGIRCIHTHPNGDGRLSTVDAESLKRLRFDAMCAIGVDENGTSNVTMAVLDESEQGYKVFAASSIYKIPQDEWMNEILAADRIIGRDALDGELGKKERVMLIGSDENSVDELERLTDTAGGEVVYKAIQKSARGIIGKGKMSELQLTAQAKNVQLAVYDDELTAVQQRTLEEEIGVPVIDRTTLILDIFAMRAATKEGKMQVELAQLEYRLTRLRGEGLTLSRQGGGIGTRGPGEEKLETDKRRINRRVYELKTQLDALSKRRGLVRKQRKKREMPQIALVGYTNAGKSTLLKALSGSEVFCEDKLFATLDPLTRRCELAKGVDACVTDTVGFIKKLPHNLVEAFRSTLEEAVFADILLHVCDGSSEELFGQMNAVNEVLLQIGASDIPTITVINKIDKAEGELPAVKDAVYISAAEGDGLDELKKRIVEELKKMAVTATVLVPFSKGDVLSAIYNRCKVISQEYTDEGTSITFSAPSEEVNRITAKLKNEA